MKTTPQLLATTILILLSTTLSSAIVLHTSPPEAHRQEGQTILLSDSTSAGLLQIGALPDLDLGNANPLRVAGLKGRRIEREEWYEYMRTYPGTSIPFQARQRGYELLQTQIGKLSPSALDVWESVGPSPIANANANTVSTNSAGRTTAVLVHPQDSNIVYVGRAQGGVWKTTDGGVTWTPLTDDQATLAIGSMAFDPTNPGIIYVGTGEPHGGGDSYYGAGILKTTNGGASWTQLGANKFAGMGIANMVVDPSNTDTVYAAASLSVIGRKPVSELPGIYKSADGGSNWTLLAQACSNPNDPNTCVSPSALIMDPGNYDGLYAAFDQIGIYKSINGGSNWTAKLGPSSAGYNFYRAEVAISSSDNSVLYAGLENASSGRGYLYVSSNGGDDWSSTGLSYSYCGEQCFYDNVIAVHPTNPDFVMAGGASLYSDVPGYDGVVFKSTNGGTSWTWNSGLSAATTVHPDLHAIAFDPSNPNTIWLGTDGGVYRSSDGGGSWENRNGNMGTLQFQSIAPHPTDPNIFFGGMQDNAKTKTTDAGASWVGLDLGDGGSAAIDPFNPTYWYGTRFSQSGSTMQFQRNDQGGSSPYTQWPVKSSGINVNDRVMFYAPLVADPNTAGRVYWGTHKLYRSNNRGDSWSAISGDLTKNQSSRSAISTIDIALGISNIILVGTTDGYVQFTTNGGSSWSNLTKSPLPNRFVSEVAIKDSQTMYVAYNGFNANTPSTPGHIFKTTNGGQTWTDVSRTGQANGLPDLPVLAIALDRDNDNLYLGTDLGVYRSADGGSSWAPFNQGLPLVAVFDLALKSYDSGKVLLAATHGRSIWRVSLTATSPLTSTFGLTLVSDTQTEYLSDSGWSPSVLSYVDPSWPSLQDASWIWKSYIVPPAEAVNGSSIVKFRRRFSLPVEVQQVTGVVRITADNAYELSLNGTVVGKDGVLDTSDVDQSWRSVELYSLNAIYGENELTIKAVNYKCPSESPDNCANPYGNPAGLLFRVDVTGVVPIYSVSGRIVDDSTNPISGVLTLASDRLSSTTDATGRYAVGNLISGTYTLTPKKSGTHSPLSHVQLACLPVLPGRISLAGLCPT